MMRVKLSTSSPDWPFLRQTPGEKGIWGNCQFFVDTDIDECDFWAVYDNVLRPETTRCPPENTLLITGEPPSIKAYSPRFLAQFAQVLTCQRGLKHPHITYSQQALPWMVGCRYTTESGWEPSYSKDYDELSALPTVPKTKLLSVLTSDKAGTLGHQRRLAFVDALRRHFGSEIDVFGRGIRPVADKWDAIAPYKYHVVIENSEYPDYWTEKLTDALLADAYPLYAGCPNIGDYFAADTLTPLSLSDFDAALAAVAGAMQSDRYEASAAARLAAKDLALNRYNLFAVLAEKAQVASRTGTPQVLHIRPSRQPRFASVRAALQRWKNPK